MYDGKNDIFKDSSWNHICMISDDNYAIYTGVALTSLKMNKKETSKYAVYIISNGISERNKDMILEIQENSFVIQIIDAIGYEKYMKNMVIEGVPATTTALYKFRIPEIFKDLDSILYIDGDVLFYKDIQPLFNYDLGNHYAIVTWEYYLSDEIPYFCKRIGVNHRYYFNSGLMMMNLRRLREENITNKLLEYRVKNTNYFMDQDAFNAIIGDDVIFFPGHYFTAFFELKKKGEYWEKSNFQKYGENKTSSIINKTYIMHLAFIKPWNERMPYITRKYLYYHAHSPFKDIKIKPMPYYKQIPKRLYKVYKKRIYPKICYSHLYNALKR